MGILTRGQIVSEALLRAGNTSLTLRANVWLELWLQKQYASAPWPFLQNRVPNFSLAQGAQSFLFGAGNGGVAEAVQRIIDPVLIYDSTYSTKDRIRVRVSTDPNLFQDETINNPSTFVGKPMWMKVEQMATQRGLMKVIPTPFPDRAYILAIDYLYLPAPIADDSQVPIYPNDETMIQVVVARAYRHMRFPRGEIEEEEGLLRTQTVDDRARYLTIPGTNDSLPLDSRVFGKNDKWWL